MSSPPAQALALGIPDVPIGTAFRCILHGERNPSAALYSDRKGEVVYHDFHAQGSREEYLTLPELRASLAAGQARKLRKTQHGTWRLRLLYEAGVLKPVWVDLPPLPADAAPHVVRAYEGFRLLLGLRWLVNRDPAPFSRAFAALWSGLSEKQASGAISELLRLGVLDKAGECPGAFGKPTPLFVPGKRSHA